MRPRAVNVVTLRPEYGKIVLARFVNIPHRPFGDHAGDTAQFRAEREYAAPSSPRSRRLLLDHDNVTGLRRLHRRRAHVCAVLLPEASPHTQLHRQHAARDSARRAQFCKPSHNALSVAAYRAHRTPRKQSSLFSRVTKSPAAALCAHLFLPTASKRIPSRCPSLPQSGNKRRNPQWSSSSPARSCPTDRGIQFRISHVFPSK